MKIINTKDLGSLFGKSSGKIIAALLAFCIAAGAGIAGIQGQDSAGHSSSTIGSSSKLASEGRYYDNGAPDLSDLSGIPDAYEVYSPLDKKGRAGVAVAKVGRDTMPARYEQRSNDGMAKIHPSGWKQAYYPELIDASNGALFNRCHLIAWSLANETANENNLITGTRQMNETMTIFEQEVADYVYKTGGHVIYRVTPDFQGSELVARGVRMEAFSVEDNGREVSFDVYIPNIQDSVEINYSTGASRRAG